jgi:ribose transport system substrate-binding protein
MTKKLGLALALSLGAVMAPAAALAKNVQIAIVGKAQGGEYWVQVRSAAEAKAKAMKDVDFSYQGPRSERDTQGQISIVENLIQKKVDGIAISPVESKALGKVIKKAMDAGIKVVTIDSDSDAKDRLSYIGTDNVGAGREAGNALAKLLGSKKGEVAIMTGPIGAQNLRQRVQGFKEALKTSGLTVLKEQSDEGDKARAVSVAEGTLRAHPNVVAFFADTAIGGPGVAQALKSAKKNGQVVLVAMDVTPALVKLLNDGTVHALIAQRPDKMGELGVTMLYDAATKGKKLSPLVDTGVEVVTKTNVAKFVK